MQFIILSCGSIALELGENMTHNELIVNDISE